ncbi:MAG TPA: nucleoside triphosphate pyrophosphatase [Gemmatimonadaceae bacterium]|nr:nucleoside triphosphate pyrophosphatase [Gemmatimonadaceae bacterium]
MSTTPRIVLASQSPRRRDLLHLIRLDHEVHPAHIDETQRAGEQPRAYAERLAREKAQAVARERRDGVVIGADTIVVVDGEVLGKPRDANDAATMLRRLSARTHIVDTAVAVVRGDRVASGVEEVEVVFRPLDDQQIERYIETGEPMDKAGAYGIQGYGATIVQRIDGDFFAVMGLPLGLLVACLRDVGVVYEFGALRDA